MTPTPANKEVTAAEPTRGPANSGAIGDCFIFTEIYGCGKIGRIALESFRRHHPHLTVHVFGTTKDFAWIKPYRNIVFHDLKSEHAILAGFNRGHWGTARLWAKVIRERQEKYVIHFDSDVIFRSEALSPLLDGLRAGHGLVGPIRNYAHNPNNREDCRQYTDVCQTYLFGFDRTLVGNWDMRTLTRMCKGEYNPLGHPIIDFFDPVMFDIIRNGGHVAHLNSDDVGGCDLMGRRANKHAAVNAIFDFGDKVTHFSSVGSGMYYYEHPWKIVGRIPPTYVQYALEKYAVFCRVFYQEKINVSYDEARYRPVFQVADWFGEARMKKPPDVSIDVVIPVFNGERYIKEAILSAQRQTYRPKRIIVVDDGSTDGTEKAVRDMSFKPVPITYVRKAHQGLSATRNAGIRASTAEFVALLDADDVWDEKKLEKQVRTLTDTDLTEVGVIYCDFDNIDESGYRLDVERFRLRRALRGDIYGALLGGNQMAGSASAALIARRHFDEVGLFDETLMAGEDWDMWLRLARVCQFDYVDEELVGLRLHRSSMQKDWGTMLTTVARVYEKWLPEIKKDPVALYRGKRWFLAMVWNMAKRGSRNIRTTRKQLPPDFERKLLGYGLMPTVFSDIFFFTCCSVALTVGVFGPNSAP